MILIEGQFEVILGLIYQLMELQARDERSSPNNRYKGVNAYSQPPSKEQIMTVLLYLIVLILHSVFVTSAIANHNSPILWILLALTYIFLVFTFIDYFYLTCTDPADNLLLGIKKPGMGDDQLKICTECGIYVHKSSYHCHHCDRCSQKFDHHCKYLNNCIGGKNYHSFIRLLSTVTLYCLTIIGESIWVFVLADNNADYDAKIISRWGALACMIFTFIMMFTVDTLLCFHLYLIFFLEKSTLQYLQALDNQATDSSKQQIGTT